MHSTDGIVKYIAECRSHGIEVLPPDINESGKEFIVTGSKIRFGLVAVKNVGESAIESIIGARDEGGRFSSLFEFCERVDLKKVNKRVIESLIKCGAFDSTGDYRSRMIASLEDGLEYGQRVQREKSDPQMGLFEMQGDRQSINLPSMPEIDEWGEKQLLALEKESLGFYITGHPLTGYEDMLEKFTNADSAILKEKNDGETVRLGGMVRNTKIIKTKKGDLMAFVTLEDLQGSVEITVFSSIYARVYDLLTDDNSIMVQGQLQKDENSVKILADTITTFEKAEETWSASIHFHLDITRTEKALLVRLNDILARHPGSCRGYVHLLHPEKTETIIALSDSMKLKAGMSLTREVKGLIGYDAVKTVCTPVASSLKSNGYNGYRKKKRFSPHI
jgi:DNA polymerase-3 subunit alpha